MACIFSFTLDLKFFYEKHGLFPPLVTMESLATPCLGILQFMDSLQPQSLSF